MIVTNNNITEKINDGKYFYYAFISGAKRIIANQTIINKINVFPVADADTGTNLASTIRSIIDSPVPTDSIKNVAVAIADAALVGARGNSGIIFAQFLYGFGNEISKYDEFSLKAFASSVNKAVKYAYEAIANPVEGTMITVIKEWAIAINEFKDSVEDIIQLFLRAFEAAKTALIETTEKLEVLKKNKVVDAGAKGFVCFLEGILDFLKGNTSLKSLSITKEELAFEALPVVEHGELTFRYCCEALISVEKHKNSDKETISNAIKHFGDSFVIAGSTKKIRLHIHTDKPQELFDTISNYADVLYQKVDDMVFQQSLTTENKNSIAILTDSTCDLPTDLLEKHFISVIPLNLHVGDNQFLDNVTISSTQFYEKLDKSKKPLSTSQPSYKDLVNKYSYLASHFKYVISIHMCGNFSGTFSNSKKAAQFVSEQTGVPIYVHDAKNLTAATGLIVLRTANLIESGKSFEEIKAELQNMNAKAKLFAVTKTVKYLVKSGRLSYAKGFFARLLNINPVLSINTEGKPEVISKIRRIEKAEKDIFDAIEKLIDGGEVHSYAVTSVRNEEMAQKFIDRMREKYGIEPVFTGFASPVLGVNAGPGVTAISIMKE
ncbi:MAG: DAK2 domain-containing protein [Bacteroidales bacterium]|jgi:DegV family protein with EDD domain